jgi:hypothetical protein
MIDKKKFLSLDTNSNEIILFSEETKEMFKEYYMVSFSDDPEEQLEEAEYSIGEIKRILEEKNFEKEILNYVAVKSCMMSNQCPYTTVAKAFAAYFEELKADHPTLDVYPGRKTLYLPDSSLPDVQRIVEHLEKGEEGLPPNVMLLKNITKEELLVSMREVFRFNHGRFPKHEQLMLFYPDYLDKYSRLKEIMFLGEGPLSSEWRYFLAILVSQK